MGATLKIKNRFLKDLDKAIKLGVEEAGIVFENTAKDKTQEDDHIVTKRYITSINANNEDRLAGKRSYKAGGGDFGIHDYMYSNGMHSLQVGSFATDPDKGMIYADTLEKRYNIFSNSYEDSKSKMINSAQKTVINSLNNIK